ncbi:hypothetical protein [Streptomyces sp. NPDC008150]|uniref:hypothetical protein n=1 Tax=Streptomyces sp. NPDC008150 TaxID=3364816 RepID=UPI0036E025A8
MPSPTARIAVLAQDLQHFHAWCRETGHRPRDRRLTYVAGPLALRALSGVTLVRYGAWTDRLDGRALERAVAEFEADTNAPVLTAG